MSAPRFSADTKNAILAEYAAGVKLGAISAKYGCDPSYPTILARRRKVVPRNPDHASLVRARERV